MKIAPMVIGHSLMRALGAVAVGLAIAFAGPVGLADGNKLNIVADNVVMQNGYVSRVNYSGRTGGLLSW